MAAKLSLLLTIALLLLALATGNPFRDVAGSAVAEPAHEARDAMPAGMPVSLQVIPPAAEVTEAFAGLEPALRALLTGAVRADGGDVTWQLRDGRTLRRGQAPGDWIVEPVRGVEHEDESEGEGETETKGKGAGR